MATTATPMGAEPTDTLSASGSFTGKFVTSKLQVGTAPLFFMAISSS